jgi:Zn-finger nucleic acid-binding protein
MAAEVEEISMSASGVAPRATSPSARVELEGCDQCLGIWRDRQGLREKGQSEIFEVFD